MGLYDIEEYDHIYVTVRRDKLEELKFCYEQFGWEEVERQEHKMYENLLDMTFRRPHKIADKDELLLLQVHLEESLNMVGKYERAPKVKTKAFASCLGILAFLLIALGLPMGIIASSTVYVALGYTMAAVGVVITPLICVFGVKLWHHENDVEARRLKIAVDLCAGICISAWEIRERGREAMAEAVKPAKEMVERIAKKAGNEDRAEKLLAKVMDVSVRKAMANRLAQAEAQADAQADADAEAVIKRAEDAGDEVIIAGDAVIVVEQDPVEDSEPALIADNVVIVPAAAPDADAPLTSAAPATPSTPATPAAPAARATLSTPAVPATPAVPEAFAAPAAVPATADTAADADADAVRPAKEVADE